MGKFKKGERVMVKYGSFKKASPGVIIDVRVVPDGKKDRRVNVHYIVEKMTPEWEPTEKFVTVTRKQIEKIPAPRVEKPAGKRKPEYHVFQVDEDPTGRSVTVVGMVDTVKEGLTFRRLRIGYAIQHPDDGKDDRMGVMVARRRCVTRPMSVFISPQPCEFRKDVVEAICRTKLLYLCNNIEDIIKGRNKDE